MSEYKALFKLPTLRDHQEWACEYGCSNVKPKLYRHVYSQTWDKLNGHLVQELAEHYYTCGREHILMVWDTTTNDYVELPEEYYQEAAQ